MTERPTLSEPDSTPRGLLRRSDQATVAALVAIALVAMIGYYVQQGGTSDRLIEIDHQPRRAPQYLVDINAATWPELAQLPGIGETLAKRIIESREVDGPFIDVDHIQRIRGIGPRTVERMRPYLLPLPDSGAVAEQ